MAAGSYSKHEARSDHCPKSADVNALPAFAARTVEALRAIHDTVVAISVTPRIPPGTMRSPWGLMLVRCRCLALPDLATTVAVAAVLAACGSPPPRPVAPLSNQLPVARASRPAEPQICVDRTSETTAAPPGVLGSLDTNLVRHVIRAHLTQLTRCYERALDHGPVRGRMNAQFTIAPDGTVGAARVTGFDDALALCLCGVVARLTFPPPNATIAVSYPFNFEPAP